jgi:hypothetical protein
MNVFVRRHCVQKSAAFSQLLQPDVMHSFGQIASGHVNPLFIIELLQKKKERKDQQNLKCHSTNGSIDGNGMQMELKCKWNFNFE